MGKIFGHVKCSVDMEIANENPYNDCHECTKVGVPVFHTFLCDSDQQPKREALAGSSLVPIRKRTNRSTTQHTENRHGRLFGPVMDPRSAKMQTWNRLILLARVIALAVDPLFLFTMSIRVRGDGRDHQPCIYMDGWTLSIVTVLRTCVDMVHVWHLWLQFRVAYVSKESLVVGCGKLVNDARAIASNYLASFTGFRFDVFVILPIPQAIYLLLVPKLLMENEVNFTISMLQVVFFLQFLPKVYHTICLMRKMRKVTGFIFGNVWWALGLNLIAYFLASHVSGGYWYILAIRRIASCLANQCQFSQLSTCNQTLSCGNEAYYTSTMETTSKPFCLDDKGNFPFGLYVFAPPLFYNNSVITKILYSNLWGLSCISTLGNNLAPTSSCFEVTFAIAMVVGSLLLFTLLIANIQVFLHTIMARQERMQHSYRDKEWWMRHMQFPTHLKRRVRRHEYHYDQRWGMIGGEDEMEYIREFPQGLRRDISRYVCLDLVKTVPLLSNFNDLILDNICDRVKSVVYSRGEKIMREGDVVKKMVFIVHGRIRRSQILSRCHIATSSMLEAGSFLGDELLFWCLRMPLPNRLPVSFATFTCVETTKAYCLDAGDLRYIIEHFRCHFANRRMKQLVKYYSYNWTTWAALCIQFAWRLYKKRHP